MPLNQRNLGLLVLKHYPQSFMTWEGPRNDESDEQFENADFSIRESLEFDLNKIIEREFHPLKQEKLRP
jgi:hypothetical protein